MEADPEWQRAGSEIRTGADLQRYLLNVGFRDSVIGFGRKKVIITADLSTCGTDFETLSQYDIEIFMIQKYVKIRKEEK